MSAPSKPLALLAVALLLLVGFCLADETAGTDLCAVHLAIVAAAIATLPLSHAGRTHIHLSSAYAGYATDLFPPPPRG